MLFLLVLLVRQSNTSSLYRVISEDEMRMASYTGVFHLGSDRPHTQGVTVLGHWS